ncbi:hypothetical protein [Rhodospirillum centenum]|uniref:Uncharacterized protein n=1 Tax=Rhodospirillum centenum (strain ATCC 51521 / SW) TaxID=414684 RepID=B6IQZ0_RHOCS|nr:hypothetical protein [Rhodospirillum centenum]ACI97876.1 hypothetical protein RC1_0437 [Rhodospirillum centenum SW]
MRPSPILPPCETTQGGNPMADIIFLGLVLAAFAAFAGLTYGCDRL